MSTDTPPLPSNLSTTTTLATQTGFSFPVLYTFPAFFTLQPVAQTRFSQLSSWSALIQSYCRHHKLFTLTLVDALNTPLFHNAQLKRTLSLRDAKSVISWMCTPEGGNRAEYVPTTTSKRKAAPGDEAEGGKVWVYWRRPEEWAAALEEWIERTGQRGTVLTLYEIVEGDASKKEEFAGMDLDLLARSLAVCVKRGKAQIFGNEGSEGVKFF